MTRTRGSKEKSTGKQTIGSVWHWLLLLLLFAVTILPIALIAHTLATTGADNLSNDYLAYVAIVDRVLNHTYDWSRLFADTFYRTHSVTLPVLLHILDAQLFRWSIYPELWFGLALATARLVLWQQTLSQGLSRWPAYLLWPLLSFLIFSNSQMSVFAFGDATIPIGLALLGFSLGTWAIVRLRARPAAALMVMLIGGLIGSFSWGNGLISWAVFLIGLVMLGYRKPWHYGVWVAGLLIALLPYIFFLALPHLSGAGHAYPGTTMVSPFNLRFIINTLGLPFANGIAHGAERLPDAQLIGWLGVISAIGALVIALRKPAMAPAKLAIPPLLFATYALLSIWQISLFRVLIAPWYTAVSVPFWAALVGFAGLFVSRKQTGQTSTASPFKNPSLLWTGLTILVITIAYVRANLTYSDKTTAFSVRCPASAAALRNYATAPTFGELYVFEWGGGYPDMLQRLASPLQKDGLSVFAPHEKWTLQGDYLLDTVKLPQSFVSPNVFWTSTRGLDGRMPWSSYQHLNLFLCAPNTVSWQVRLPSTLKSAKFVTAAGISTSAAAGKPAPGVISRITLTLGNGKAITSFSQLVRADNPNWHDIEVPLDNCAGQTAKLELAVMGLPGAATTAAVFKFPHIDVELSKPEPAPQPVKIIPSNTDLSASAKQPGPDDLRLDNLSGKEPLSIDPSQFTEFWVTVAEEAQVLPRGVKVDFLTSNGNLSCVIPLLAGPESHTYTYPLRLLDLDTSSRISAIKVQPLAGTASAQQTNISSYGLMRRRK